MAVVLVIGAGLASRLACAQSPQPYIPTNADRKLLAESAEIDSQLERRGLVYHLPELEQHLAQVAAPLLPAASPEYVNWRFRILREPLINAESFPNGSVYLNTGLLALLENDDQLAGVLAHEITHVAHRHTFQYFKSYRKKMVAMDLISIAWRPGVGAPVMMVIGDVSQFAMVVSVLGYGRELEREADDNAVALLTGSHRDPAQFARAFELLDERLDPEPVSTFYRDHAKSAERAARVLAMIHGAKAMHPGADPAYVARMAPAIRQNIGLDLESRRFRTAVARARRLVEVFPASPEDLYWLGEAYRSLGPRSTEPAAGERTDRGQNQAYRKAAKPTLEEENKALAATAEGKAAMAWSQSRAAESFEKAAALDARAAAPHLGLGLLYEQQNKRRDALAEYRKYLELVPSGAGDRMRVERRAEALRNGSEPLP